jgi:hypothetical protein
VIVVEYPVKERRRSRIYTKNIKTGNATRKTVKVQQRKERSEPAGLGKKRAGGSKA